MVALFAGNFSLDGFNILWSYKFLFLSDGRYTVLSCDERFGDCVANAAQESNCEHLADCFRPSKPAFNDSK